MTSALLARSANAALSASQASRRAASAPRRGGPVRVVAKGDGARVDRSSKRDVM